MQINDGEIALSEGRSILESLSERVWAGIHAGVCRGEWVACVCACQNFIHADIATGGYKRLKSMRGCAAATVAV